MKHLHFDCTAGISGDMTVGALIDLGLPLEHLRTELARLPLPTHLYRIATEPCQRRGISASRFIVQVAEEHHHRHYDDIRRMIEESTLADRVKELALRIFRRLAEAEATVHGVAVEEVHFHEVGAVDSIIDIVGAAIGLEYLAVSTISAGALPLGSGFIETAHGRLPVPAPATAELLKGLPVHGTAGPGERVTPTGAAIVATLATDFGTVPPMQVTGIGSGGGAKDFTDVPNILRLFLGDPGASGWNDEIQVLETHIDDMTPEVAGFLMERLLDADALDVAYTPLMMKKNRPGIKLTVLAAPATADRLARLVLAESTAIGIRRYRADRLVLERRSEERETSFGTVRVKVISDHGRLLRITPEFDECRRLALSLGIPILEVYRSIERECAAQ